MADFEARSLKEALHETIHRNKKSVAAIAEECAMSANYLSRAALFDTHEGGSDSGCKFPLNRLVPLVRATGNFSALDYLEQCLGRVAVPVSLPECRVADLPANMARAVTEFGDVLKKYAAMVADGKVSRVEAEQFSTEAYEAMREIAAFNQAVRKAAGLNG